MVDGRLDSTFSALADPTRRGILAALALGEKPVSELAAPYRMSLADAAKHVEVLARAWTTQFRYRDEARRARDVRQLRPLAESFIGLLEAQEGRVGPY